MAESLDLKQLSKELKDAGTPWEMDESTDMALMTEDERRQRLGFIPTRLANDSIVNSRFLIIFV